jgi:hypothetical protein
VRRLLAAALAVVCGTTVLTACSSDPVPTDVAVGWSGDGRTAVQVSWNDDNAPNRITIEGVLSESPSYVKYIGAGEANSWDIPTSAFPPDGNYRVAVAIGTSQGGVTSKLARSPVFDTDGPVGPSAATVAPVGRSGALMQWTVPVAPQDFTPNDPLDVKGPRTQTYVPMVGKPGEQLRPIGPATASTRQVINSLKPPYVFQVRTQNEWSTRLGGQVLGLTSSVSASMPGLAQFSLPVRARGRVILQQVACEPETPCTQRRVTPAGVPIVVLTQVIPGGRWTPVARGKTTAGGHYDVGVPTGGSRPYAVAVPNYTKPGLLTSTSASRPTYVRNVVRVASAGFAGGLTVKKRGSNVTAFAIIKPAMSSTATLQVWNRVLRRWVGVKETPIRNGRTTWTFRAGSAGTFVYRFVLPAATMYGRSMSGTITQHLLLYVR